MTDSGELWNSRDEMAGRSLDFVAGETIFMSRLDLSPSRLSI